MDILGAPIGSKDHCESWIHQKLNDKLPSLLEKIAFLEDSQSSFLILRYCVGFCKMVWYLRTVPPNLISDSCKHFDSLIMQAFENLIGCGLPSPSLKQSQLGPKFGGIGLRSSLQHSTAGYISSFFASKSLAETFLHKPIFNPSIMTSLSCYNSKVSLEDRLQTFAEPNSQKLLSSKIDAFNAKELHESSNIIDKARILSCSSPHASAWIIALPIFQNKFTNLEWVLAMKRWLGIPVFNEDHLCSACGKMVMDKFGHHAAVCPVSGDRIKRHNAVRDCIYTFCSTAAWGPVKEKPFLLPGTSEKPADIFLPSFSSGQSCVVDVAGTCPVQQKYVRQASYEQCFAANQYAVEIKRASFEERVRLEGHDYLPIIFESFGAFSEDSFVCFNKLINGIKLRINEPHTVVSKTFFESLSCVIMRSYSRSVSSRFPEISFQL